MKNKKGADKLISVYWFAILIIIAGGIVLMVNSFYSSPYDVREVEAEILAQKVADCVYYGGEINPFLNSNGIFRDEFRDNFLDRCNLDFGVVEGFEEIDYFVYLNFLENGDEKLSRFEIKKGNLNLENDCYVENVKKEKLSTCVKKDFLLESPQGKLYLVKIISVVRKIEENVK